MLLQKKMLKNAIKSVKIVIILVRFTLTFTEYTTKNSLHGVIFIAFFGERTFYIYKSKYNFFNFFLNVNKL